MSLSFNSYPICLLSDMGTLLSTTYSSRRNYLLSLPDPKTTTFNLDSFTYLAAKLWNSLLNSLRTSTLNERYYNMNLFNSTAGYIVLLCTWFSSFIILAYLSVLVLHLVIFLCSQRYLANFSN